MATSPHRSVNDINATASIADNKRRSLPAGLEIENLRGTIPGLEFLELIGSGGMGAVYRARQTDLDRIVAVKVLPPHLSGDPMFVERFRREARAMAIMDHPNIVTVYDSGVLNGRAYIIMEYIEGTNLRGALESGAVDAESALEIVPKICDGLAYAHRSGVVHRDIKPENVLLGTGNRVKIVDFGLAKWVDNAETESSLTATGTRMGTVRYMAPEQFDGNNVDARADIYSLGVMFYEMLTGEVPMGAFRMPSETVGTDPRIDQVIDRTLQRRPADRYQSVGEFNEELSAISEVGGTHWSQSVTSPAVRAMNDAAFSMASALSPYFHYESEAKIFGIPILSVCYGIDPQTRQRGIAKGIIAVGDQAVGGIAIGGASCGVIAMGGAAIGVNAFGGAAIGLQSAMGGAAISSGISCGGAAIGLLALGGGSLGVLVPNKFGSLGVGSLSNILRNGDTDNSVESSLQHFASLPETPWVIDMILAQAFLGPLGVVLFVALIGVIRWNQSQDDKPNKRSKRRASLSGLPLTTNQVPYGKLIPSLIVPCMICAAAFITFVVLNHSLLPI